MRDIQSANGKYKITPLSDRSLLVSFGNIIDEAINERVQFLHQALLQSAFGGFIESVPAYASLAVFYDIQKVRESGQPSAFAFVKSYLERLLVQDFTRHGGQSANINIPVCYDVEFGVDLMHVARHSGLSISDVINIHTSTIYRIYMIGFTPGFAYMGTVDEKLFIPRKESPRLVVPAGSVAIAGSQTGIYPIDSPGGWHLIGKTPLQLFEKHKEIPCLLSAGDSIRFYAITKNEFTESGGH